MLNNVATFTPKPSLRAVAIDPLDDAVRGVEIASDALMGELLDADSSARAQQIAIAADALQVRLGAVVYAATDRVAQLQKLETAPCAYCSDAPAVPEHGEYCCSGCAIAAETDGRRRR